MTKAQLSQSLAAVRRQGYAYQDSMFGNGLRILAAPGARRGRLSRSGGERGGAGDPLTLEKFSARALDRCAPPRRNRARRAGERHRLDGQFRSH